MLSSDFTSGAIAGFAVDVALLPIDTAKTRAQSAKGFAAAGGFKGLYAGFAPAAACSVPSGAFFFASYEWAKRTTGSWTAAAIVGEAAACLVRVPCDNIKQRLQAGYAQTVKQAIGKIVADVGPLGFYRGYGVTLARELPFAAIQFGLVERCKLRFGSETHRVAAYGAVCGGAAGAITTPLDVAKTRVMLQEAEGSLPVVVARIAREEGMMALFRGVGPRVLFLSTGGFVFIGAFHAAQHILY
jgi:solute carrier family 25 S-adenosylmethionine transporter 26